MAWGRLPFDSIRPQSRFDGSGSEIDKLNLSLYIIAYNIYESMIDLFSPLTDNIGQSLN